MGHSRQDGGFAEAPTAPLEGYPLIPVTEGLGPLRPDIHHRAEYTHDKPPKPEKADVGRVLRIVS